jgi:1-acyl-sn-glycerol-3-phosphate acyltransferase
MIFNKQLIQKTIDWSEKYDLRYAVGELWKNLGITSISKKGNLPANGPLIIISNHTGIFDSLLMFSHVERNDLHVVALSTYGIFGSKMKEKLLPIYRVRRLNHKLYEYPLCLQINGKPPENLPEPKIKVKNRKTIGKAAGLVNEGSAISIFPTGSAGKRVKNSNWKAGVGFLVKQITNPQTNVTFACINGTRKSDLVAYLHPFISKILFKPQPISITFSKPQLLRELTNPDEDAKTITRKLEKVYLNLWI